MTSEPLILHIETATTVCSVAVSRGSAILSSRELDAGYTHAENLHLFISEVLQKAGSAPGQLNAIALSAGPGSYTGLRIGSSTAKGLCFSLDIPLITIGTLRIMAEQARRQEPHAAFYCPMIDAGRMEVYTAVFNHGLEEIYETRALILTDESVSALQNFNGIVIGGTGMEKATGVLQKLPSAKLLNGIRPSAQFMMEEASRKFRRSDFTQNADFEPFYLKKYIAGKKKGEL